jgi:hypothetical protein
MPFPVARANTTPPIWPAGSTGNGLATNGFVPEIWSGKLVEKFYDTTVLAAISNTDYEGEIKNHGDKVIIRTKPTISINEYKVDGALALQRPVGSTVELHIDQGEYFAVILDDVMAKQSDLNNLSMWAEDATEQFKQVIDRKVLTGILGQSAAANRGNTAGRISQDVNLGSSGAPLALVADKPGAGEVDILDAILRLGQVLDEQNTPETGRWLVLPTWAATMIKRSELRQAYLSGDGVSMLRNGRVGMIDRFTLYTSNLLPIGAAGGLEAGESVMYAGHAHGLTFATQFSKVETMKAESTFGEILRGLQVYGYKVVDGVALSQAVIAKA